MDNLSDNKKVLLHSCCAPCASYPIELLKQDNFEVIVYFYNPNIYPKAEYIIRRDELKNYCKNLGVSFVEEPYNPEVFYSEIKGMEKEPEKGSRCSKCFYLRLYKTAEFAKNNGIDFFTTTLTVSPHKNSNQIFAEAKKVEENFEVKFLEYNFKKNDGFKKSREIAKQNNMYAQNYCGCEFSKIARENI